MRKILKALSSVVVSMVLILTLIPCASAANITEASSTFSPTTVVTKNNVYQVLKSLGIDTKKVKETNLKTTATQTYTVQDLKNAIQSNNKETKNVNSKSDLIVNQNKILNLNQLNPTLSNANGTFTRTVSFNEFDLIFSINANYISDYGVHQWTSVNSTSVGIRQTAISLISHQLDSASTRGSFSYSDIIEYSTVVVGNYMTVQVGNQSLQVELNTNKITSVVHFYPSDYI